MNQRFSLNFLCMHFIAQRPNWLDHHSSIISLPDELLTLSRCCNRRGFFHFKIVFLQKWVFAGRLGFLVSLWSFISMTKLSRSFKLRQLEYFQPVSSRKFACRLSISTRDGQWITFEHYNRQGFFGLKVVFRRRWVFAGRLGFLLCFWSFISMIRCFRWPQLPQSWFYQLRF